MKQQKRSLTEALQAVAIRPPHPASVMAARSQPAKAPVEVERSPEPPAIISARAGKRLIGGHFDRSVSRQLRELAAREDSTVQALLAEALNMLFAACELPQIAEP
jgi:hypothetical protein